RALGAALSAITAAVVGVILNLAVWFALHTLFSSVSEARILGMAFPSVNPLGLDPICLAFAVIAFVGMRRYHWSMVYVISGSAIAGLGRWLLMAAAA
ncbi:chromate transporter, partial [Candidatus Sumerlaeota bacterium]|nr:chromate transporter [Candidatus Sumerlaeota bacterium]